MQRSAYLLVYVRTLTPWVFVVAVPSLLPAAYSIPRTLLLALLSASRSRQTMQCTCSFSLWSRSIVREIRPIISNIMIPSAPPFAATSPGLRSASAARQLRPALSRTVHSCSIPNATFQKTSFLKLSILLFPIQQYAWHTPEKSGEFLRSHSSTTNLRPPLLGSFPSPVPKTAVGTNHFERQFR